MKKALIAVLAVFTAAALFAGCAKQETVTKKFTVGFDAEYPPYGYMAEDGTYTGFDLELAEALCKLEGWELVKTPIDWGTKDQTLNAGEIDVIWNGFTMNGREDDYEFSVPYVDNSQVIVVAKNAGIESLSDLAGKKVGVQQGSAALELLENAGEDGQKELRDTFGSLDQFADYNTAFQELIAGALDALAIDVGVAKYQIENRGDDQYVILAEISKEQYAVGAKKGNKELIETINKDLKKLYADGTVKTLAEKYGIADMIIEP